MGAVCLALEADYFPGMLVDRRLSVTSPQRYCNRFILAVWTGC